MGTYIIRDNLPKILHLNINMSMYIRNYSGRTSPFRGFLNYIVGLFWVIDCYNIVRPSKLVVVQHNEAGIYSLNLRPECAKYLKEYM